MKLVSFCHVEDLNLNFDFDLRRIYDKFVDYPNTINTHDFPSIFTKVE